MGGFWQGSCVRGPGAGMIHTTRWTRGALCGVLLALVGTLGALAPTSTVPASAAARTSARDVFSGSTGKNGLDVSPNWAGYVVTGASVTTVSGGWIQPTATCAGKATQSAFWVGIDGFATTDPTVQQVGTDADCTKKTHKIAGGPSYYAWYEMYPGPLVPLSTSVYPVAPGDQLSASVTQEGASYKLDITDAGRWSYSTLQTPTTVPLDASGEWIVEAPTSCKATKCTPVPLTDFGTVDFTSASVGDLAITNSGLSPAKIEMAKNKKGTVLKASTSALTTTAGGFDVTWVGS